jgi:regulator of RNase E activity RraA
MTGIIYKKINRAEKIVIEDFGKISTTIISDAMNRTNVMKASIKPLIENVRIAGNAITVKCIVGDNIMTHMAIYLAMAGDIIVIDGKGYADKSIWGGIQTEVSKDRGIEGIVIDGSIRDIQDVKKLQYPVFCSGVTSAGPHKGWGDSINVPIQCGGVPVHPGDIIVGDDDGVVVVPLKDANEVLEKAKEIMKLEEGWMKKIEDGKTTLEATGLDKKFNEMNVKIVDGAWE